MGRTPRLHESLVADYFDVSSDDHSPEHGKSTARFRVDFGWHTGERREPLCIQGHDFAALSHLRENTDSLPSVCLEYCPGPPHFFDHPDSHAKRGLRNGRMDARLRLPYLRPVSFLVDLYLVAERQRRGSPGKTSVASDK